MKNKLLFTGIILLVFGFVCIGCEGGFVDLHFVDSPDDHTYTIKYEVIAVFPPNSDDKIMSVRYSKDVTEYVDDNSIKYGNFKAGEVEHSVKSPWEKTIKIRTEEQEGELFLFLSAVVDDTFSTNLKVTIYVNGEEKASQSSKSGYVLVRYSGELYSLPAN
jgi:hypothetical protein